MALIESARVLPSLTLTTPSAAHAFCFTGVEPGVAAAAKQYPRGER